MTDRSVVHGSFTIEREYPHPVSKVFRAWADPAFKRKWFGGGDPALQHEMEFEVGGWERSAGPGPDGSTFSYDALYQDIVPENRIIYSYDMHMNGQRLSVSLASIEFSPNGAGCTMKMTEYGLFLDGLDTSEQREHGTRWLLGTLGSVLDASDD